MGCGYASCVTYNGGGGAGSRSSSLSLSSSSSSSSPSSFLFLFLFFDGVPVLLPPLLGRWRTREAWFMKERISELVVGGCGT